MPEKPRVLFLNPPGRRVYLRDYFCSKVSQADYINQPIDFVFLSGWLKDTCELGLVDAIVERRSVSACVTAVRRFDPDVVVGLIGSVSYDEDVAFYKRLVECLSTRLVLIGDVLIERRRERLQQLSFVDAFLHDFGTDVLRDYLRGSRSDLMNITYRDNGLVRAAALDRRRGERFELPVPRHDLFLDKDYRYPFVRRRRFATLMTEVGCPYRCTFCIMSTLGWRIRPVENVLEELRLLRSLNVRELFFLDQTFGIQKERAHQLLEAMASFDPRFGWVGFSRPDVLDEELVGWMKAAGCHTLILGVESGNEQILESVKKDYDKEEVRAGFLLCSRHGIRTVATLILGLPEETQETFAETMAFLKELDPDFASFNVAVPRLGTPFRGTALELGLVQSDLEVMDQSGSEIAMPTLTLSRDEIRDLKQRAVREFYFGFGSLRRRLARWMFDRGGVTGDLRIQLRQGYGLLRNVLNQYR